MKCLGERYIGCGAGSGTIELEGVPGNALGAYLDGATIIVRGNAQDATGDTMNGGEITVYGSTGDAAGYSMRGGRIYVRGDAGYRAGIHMKAYRDRIPAMVIGGRAGSFLGEYLAGGCIVVLGLGAGDAPPVGDFCGTGMHGGRIYLRTETLPADLPAQVSAHEAAEEDMREIEPLIRGYCERFGADEQEINSGKFYVLTADTKNPYRQLYCSN